MLVWPEAPLGEPRDANGSRQPQKGHGHNFCVGSTTSVSHSAATYSASGSGRRGSGLRQCPIGVRDDLPNRRGPPTRAAMSGGDSFAIQRLSNRRKRHPRSPLHRDSGDDLLAEVPGTATTRPRIPEKLGQRRSRHADRAPRRPALARSNTHAAVNGVQAHAQQISCLAPRHKATRLPQQLATPPCKLDSRRSRSSVRRGIIGHDANTNCTFGATVWIIR